MIYLTNIDLNRNELQNAVLQPLATPPANPKLGQIYTDSTTNKIRWFNGTGWTTVGMIVEGSDINGAIKVDGVDMHVYSLPTATPSVLGGVRVPASGGLVVDLDGNLSKRVNLWTITRAEGQTDLEAMEAGLLDWNATPNAGDYFIVQYPISEDIISRTAYVYHMEGEHGAWVALDGNVDASNVYLDADIVTAGDYTQVGNITKGATETGTLAAKGLSLQEVLTSIFTKELNPSKVDPSITLTLAGAGAKEVGTFYTPSFTAVFNKGSYTYGPDSAVEVSAWSASDTNGGSSSATSSATTFGDVGTMAAFTVGDSTDYKVTVTVTHSAGAVPHTNMGDEYADAQIQAGTKSATSSAVTGYRSFFYGCNSTAVELNSANIRALTNSGKAVGTRQAFSLPIAEGTTQVIIAFPTNAGKSLTSVIDKGAMNAPLQNDFVKSAVAVEGVNGYTAVSYDVYVYSPQTALGENTYDIEIS